MTPSDPLLPLLRLRRAEQQRWLEALYDHCNHSRYRETDPVEFLWRFASREDRELVAWIAAGLAFGRVASIRNAVETVLELMDGDPTTYVFRNSEQDIQCGLETFQYRWTRGGQLANLLIAWKRFRENGACAEDLLTRHVESGPGGLRKAFAVLRADLLALAPGDVGHLLPAADGSGACKRPAMMLRWLVRRDVIDPGVWSSLDPASLWIPLDTHMFRMGRRLRFTRRRTPDARCAEEITRAFARMVPGDPTRYDFCMTRLGMLPALMDLDGEAPGPPGSG